MKNLLKMLAYMMPMMLALCIFGGMGMAISYGLFGTPTVHSGDVLAGGIFGCAVASGWGTWLLWDDSLGKKWWNE